MFLPITDQYGSADDLQHVHQSTLTETKPETGRSLRLLSYISVQHYVKATVPQAYYRLSQ